jgi:putative NADH-flavin reductase
MIVLVVGANGATGKLVVEQLLNQGIEVRAIVRSLESLPSNPKLSKIKASVHSITSSEMAIHIKDCSAIVSCLGHNLTFKGMFGEPRLLVTETLQCICKAIISNECDTAIKVILMNTTGNSNRDIPEKPPLSQRIVTAILRSILPPHVDNENAADYLRTEIGQHNKAIEWVAVRPDALVDEKAVTEYNLHASPIRNPIFNSGATSRINVANFMTELILKEDIWQKWKGAMPVIYNNT